MLTCYQFENMNMLQHGQAVHQKYLELRSHLIDGTPLTSEWRLPGYLHDLWETYKDTLPDEETLRLYQIYHDCGKHICRTVDDQGRQHFPDHAEASYRRFLNHSNNFMAAELIRLDMTFHTLRGEELEPFFTHPLGFTLWLTTLCELHANAEMFGGIESDSFKIKWKRHDKAGKKFLLVTA
jgi:hypothetical protein